MFLDSPAYYVELYLSGFADVPSLSPIATGAQRSSGKQRKRGGAHCRKILRIFVKPIGRNCGTRSPPPSCTGAVVDHSTLVRSPARSLCRRRRTTDLLPKSQLTKGLALPVLAEVERGNEMGVYIA